MIGVGDYAELCVKRPDFPKSSLEEFYDETLREKRKFEAIKKLIKANQEYEKALDFWFKIKNNFSFNYMLLMDQALCHIFLGDFSAISDLAFAFDMMNRNGI